MQTSTRILLSICAASVVAALVWLSARRAAGPDVDRTQPPNLVLVSIDTLRADRLGAYGYRRPTTPHIDRVAAAGVRFDYALSQSTWTLPAMASIMTSRYPIEHGATRVLKRIPEQLPTVAEALQDSGYHTVAVVSHALVNRERGFAQGFDVFDQALQATRGSVTSRQLTERALRLLGPHPPEPFFLWVHYFDPHHDYVRHPEFDFASADHWIGEYVSILSLGALAERDRKGIAPLATSDLAHVNAVYDEEVAFTDRWVGKLLDSLGRRHLRRRLVSAITADHGEHFFEHQQFGHNQDVYDTLVRVPLVIGGDVETALRGRVVERSVETASLAKTLAQLGSASTTGLQGEDLMAVARGLEAEPPVCFSEGSMSMHDRGRQLAAVVDGYKLIRHLDDDTHELYRRRDDPLEQHDLWHNEASDVVRIKRRLLAAMARFRSREGGEAPAADVPPQDIALLRALGYVE